MKPSTYEEALEYLNGLIPFGWRPGLERFTALCERLGSPHEKLRSVLVAGTNGKGSTTTMISAILMAAGYRVGTYYSPYMYDIRERVQLNLSEIGKEDFARLIDVIRPHAEALSETELGHPTEFEVKTALGLLFFAQELVDFAVLEVGLGGRLDATNIVMPMVSVITNVTLDHMDRLGETVSEIAAEKAGIVKDEGFLVTASADPEALAVIERVCGERDSKLWHVFASDSEYVVAPGVHLESPESLGSEFRVRGMHRTYEHLKLRMAGEFQRLNAATAIGAVEALEEKGVSVGESAFSSGLESAYLPGRLEVLQTNPTLLIDAAHNLDAARKLARALKEGFSYDKLIVVMGMASGHSIDDVVGTLAPLADRFFATAAANVRAAAASEVAGEARKHCGDVAVVETVAEAVHRALEVAGANDLICVTGSFYVIGEVPRGVDF